MKQVHKLILALCLSCGFFFLPSTAGRQYEAKAQGMPTIDVSNLLQNILDFLTNLDSYDIDAEKLEGWHQKIEQARTIIGYVQQGANIYNTAAYAWNVSNAIVDELDYMWTARDWFIANGASQWVVVATVNCYDEFKKLAYDLVADFQTTMSTIKNSKTDADVDVLFETQKYLSDMQNKIHLVSSHYRGEISKLYYDEMRVRQSVSNAAARTMIIY